MHARADDLVGLTLEQALPVLPEDPTYLVQDASPAVGEPAAYSATEMGSPRWTVVAACADADVLSEATIIEIAVVPTGLVPDRDSEEWISLTTHVVACEF